ncbi:pantetheine-phosphate adenylyltransferase [Peptostreptococcus equinus]|uniref:Phosphopantetheine adenylyltransferase n=1 Tax=Peptostreptococcus equinus TaxID=3003601 RepID=A0ABY7JLK8_9FIRM|nr:pantetheine-phosphate adenylyltransferase [Peptostreptococcus sp. CBA3647]WAW14217.1 pantetheine-phosphate adenylyltransferase [Peptostreptococcus sp. CBA3647]
MNKDIRAIFAGSFDPITNGHLDIIERASKLFAELKIGLLINPNKSTLFTVEERVNLIKESVQHLDNVEVIFFDGLLIDYCRNNDISVLVRGVRSSADVDYELQMAHMNKELENEIETVILPTNTKYSFISSSLIKEVIKFNASIDRLVPNCVARELKNKDFSK